MKCDLTCSKHTCFNMGRCVLTDRSIIEPFFNLNLLLYMSSSYHTFAASLDNNTEQVYLIHITNSNVMNQGEAERNSGKAPSITFRHTPCPNSHSPEERERLPLEDHWALWEREGERHLMSFPTAGRQCTLSHVHHNLYIGQAVPRNAVQRHLWAHIGHCS